MRFFAVAALFLGSVALAAPSTGKTKDCCCCDISQPAIVCKKNVKTEDCICAAVVCPVNAPTYWPATARPTATSVPTSAVAAKREEPKEPPTPAGPPCCCCDPSKDAIVCELRAQGEDNTCMCPMVKCSAGVKTLTVWPGAEETSI
ncbi:Ff.00g119670.m01.CDS01 [Fusarium sp. VM40]|nr:Ff.00g119670.m01.CDS01 [Fusarium sp. VM40]